MSLRTRRRPRLITTPFLLIAAATLAFFTSAGVTLPAVPLYVAGPLGGSNVAVGLSVALFSVSALLARPFAGRLGDTRGRRLIMVAGGLTVGVSILGYAASSSIPVLNLFRLLTGVGEAFFFTGATAAIVDLAPEERRGEAVSFFSLALYLGIGVGPFIGELVIDAFGFTATWMVTAALSGAAGALALAVPETRPEVTGTSSRTRLLHPAALLPGTALLASVWGQSGFFAFVPLYAPTLGLAGSRFVFILYSAIVIAIRSFGATIPDRIGPVRASRVSLAFSAIGLTLVALLRSPVGLFVGVSVFAIGSALAFPALVTLALRGTDPAERGVVMGTVGAFVDLAFGVGPAALGLVSATLGYRGAFLTAALVAGAGLMLVLGAYRLRTQPSEARLPRSGGG
jgi:MFS family permease